MPAPTAVVFDLDGTLIDSRGDIVAAVNHALVDTGRSPLGARVIVGFVGDGARVLCARAADLPEKSPEVDALLDRFLAYYAAHPVDFTTWMPGAEEALAALGTMPGMALGICTNKPRKTTEIVLSALGGRDRFGVVCAGGDVPEPKPAPDSLLHLMKLLDCLPEALVMVGDSPQDVLCARRAHVRSVVVPHGFASRERVLEALPDVVIENLVELPDVLRRWGASR